MRVLAGMTCVLLAGGSALAAESAVEADGHARLTLVADVESVPAGEPFRVGVRFQLDPGWHVYWHNPGQAGMATTLAWKSDVVQVGPIAWPAPTRFATEDGFIVTYGYAGEVLLHAEARASASGVLEVTGDFLVCQIDCIPGSIALSRRVEVGPRRAANQDLFAAAVAAVPVAPEAAGVRVVADGETLRLVGAGKLKAFFPAKNSLKLVGSADAADGVTLDVEGTGNAVVVFESGKAVELTVGAPLPAAATGAPSFLLMLAFALLGGIILNLMPCVLPVLAFKATGLARLAGEARGARLRHALAYLAGIQVALGALAALVLALRAAGTQVGWGFQFQQPIFLALVGGLLVLMAMNAFGVFTVEVGGVAGSLLERVERQGGLRRSVGEGALAVVLATPCSAPLVGSAVGYALAAPAPQVLAVFALLGVGLWLPFALLAAGARRILPRPGRWMETLEQAMGFALIGGALWVLWVGARAAGVDGAARMALFWLVVAVAGWIVGRAQLGARRRLALGAAVLLALGAGTATLRFHHAPATEASADGWLAWDEAAIARAVGQGRTVFVDFTADWCITCKVNERTAIETAEVRALMEREDVARFRADWTRPDEKIRAALARHGRAGVPMYLVYRPENAGRPDVLPEILTPSILREALTAREN